MPVRISRRAADTQWPVRRGFPATPQARQAVRLARAEANESASGELGSGHVLLGVLRTDSETARALWSAGITVDRARPLVRSGDETCIRRVLHAARELAGVRGPVKPEHLLAAALYDHDEGARCALAALGASAGSIRARPGR